MKIKYLLSIATLFSSGCFAVADNKDCVDIAIFSINDFHGALVTNPAKGLPGAASLVHTLDSLKTIYPHHLTVAAGDNFGGSFFYKATRPHTLMPQFFYDMGINISAVGNHEWDDGKAETALKWRDADIYPQNWSFKYVCANTREADGKIPDYMTPCTVDSIKISEGRNIKVGFVGLLTSNTPRQASKRNLKGLFFDGDYPKVLDSLKHTTAYKPIEDAEIRILLTHIGTDMEKGKPVWQDKDMPILYSIKDTSFHAIISSHSHQLVCGYINDIHYPIVQGKSHGMYICGLIFKVDTTSMTIKKVVPKVFPVTPKKHLNIKARRLQSQIEEQLATTLTPAGVPIGTQLTYARNDIPHDRDHKHRQVIIGNWICSSYAECARKAAQLSDTDIVVGVSHIGTIRTGFTKGPVSVLDVGEVLPFNNSLRLFRLTGKQLEELIQYGLHNEKYGYIQMGNLKARLNKKREVTGLTYISPKGMSRTIKKSDICYVAADDFMSNGGDGYLPSQFPANQEIKGLKMEKSTDAFIHYLKTIPYLENSEF